MNKQLLLAFHNKLIVDLFAGGGGMSCAFEMAFGRSPDIAINHNDDALSMHRANHPQTRHFVADVYEVCPVSVTQGVPVGWLHASPDCTHHSQAAGGQPRSKKIRGLAWVAYRWAGQVMPDVISLENVKQILHWGPLVAKRCKVTGRVLKLDGAVAEIGEQVPVREQYLVPDPKRQGQTWRKFVAALNALGYVVDWRVMNAADFGGHTTRERLFLLARRDGQAIVWPEPTHFKKPEKGQKRWLPAADCIDFSLPSRSIFDRPKHLATATMTRIARGVKKFVLDNPKPFIVPIAHYNGSCTVHSIDDPLRTITAATKGGEFSLATPVLVQAGHGEGKPGAKRWSYGANDITGPLGTVTASGGGQALATAYLMQANGGFNTTPGHSADEPLSTVTNTGSQQQLVTAFLSSYYTDDSNRCRDVRDPTATITTENRLGLVECELSPDDEAGALRVAAFLVRYYGEGGQWSEITDPMATITTKDRLALVTVHVAGTPYVIVDIRLRMLQPPELYRAQDFPDDYIIRAQMGFGSAGATKGTTGFRIDTKREYETAQHVWAQYPSNMAALGLRMTGVLIENRPAIDVLLAHDSPDTLFYVDPPYVHDTRCRVSMGSARGYRHEMTDDDHLQLLDALQTLQGMVVLSGYHHPIYEEALDGWELREKSARISGGRGTAKRTECVWINPACARSRRSIQMRMI